MKPRTTSLWRLDYRHPTQGPQTAWEPTRPRAVRRAEDLSREGQSADLVTCARVTIPLEPFALCLWLELLPLEPSPAQTATTTCPPEPCASDAPPTAAPTATGTSPSR